MIMVIITLFIVCLLCVRFSNTLLCLLILQGSYNYPKFTYKKLETSSFMTC